MNKREQAKSRIEKAGIECFEKYGLDKTTLEDISKAVGLNKTSLYYYYKKKEDIFIEVVVREGEHIFKLYKRPNQRNQKSKNVLVFI